MHKAYVERPMLGAWRESTGPKQAVGVRRREQGREQLRVVTVRFGEGGTIQVA